MALPPLVRSSAPEADPVESLRSIAQANAMAIESQLIGDSVAVYPGAPDDFVVVAHLLLRQAIERVLHRQEEVFPLPVWLLTPDDDLLRKVAPVSTPSPVPADYRCVQAVRRYPALAAYLEGFRNGRTMRGGAVVTVTGPKGDGTWHAFGLDGVYLCEIYPSLDT